MWVVGKEEQVWSGIEFGITASENITADNRTASKIRAIEWELEAQLA